LQLGGTLRARRPFHLIDLATSNKRFHHIISGTLKRPVVKIQKKKQTQKGEAEAEDDAGSRVSV
jgi:hypothetical protein